METLIFDDFRRALLGKKVSRVSRGYGSAISVEFGALHPVLRPDGSEAIRPDGSKYGVIGEITLLIEWSWRVEGEVSILGGSFSDSESWPALFLKMEKAEVLEVVLFGRLPEIEVILSNGVRLLSFMTAEDQPAWSLISRIRPMGSMFVEDGRLTFEL